MKTLLCTMFGVVALTAKLTAATPLVLDAVVTDLDERGGEKVIGSFHVLIADGQQTVLAVDKARFTVTPSLRADGTVDLVQALTHPNYKSQPVELGFYRQNSVLGQAREISFGSVTYATQVSRAD